VFFTSVRQRLCHFSQSAFVLHRVFPNSFFPEGGARLLIPDAFFSSRAALLRLLIANARGMTVLSSLGATPFPATLYVDPGRGLVPSSVTFLEKGGLRREGIKRS